jgi:hypothetical protein
MLYRDDVADIPSDGTDKVEPRAENPTNLEKLVGELAEGLAMTKRNVASLIREVAVLGKIPMGVPVSRVDTQERAINDMLARLAKLEDETVKLRQGAVYREGDSAGLRALMSAQEKRLEKLEERRIGSQSPDDPAWDIVLKELARRLDALTVDVKRIGIENDILKSMRDDVIEMRLATQRHENLLKDLRKFYAVVSDAAANVVEEAEGA